MSSNNAIQQVSDFAKEIESLFPGVMIKLEGFSSGAYMLEIRWCERFFALDYSPSDGFFSVYEVTENYVFLVAPDFVTEDFYEAKSHLIKLIEMV